jgi:hypothetical protein
MMRGRWRGTSSHADFGAIIVNPRSVDFFEPYGMMLVLHIRGNQIEILDTPEHRAELSAAFADASPR